MKVLIADDEMVVRVGLKSLIEWENYGYQLVGEAANGEQALQAILKYRPDVVITDIKMPVMDGLQLLRELQTLPQSTPKVVVLSSFSDFELVRQAMQLGAVDYLLKTRMEKKDILEVLEKITKGSSPTRKMLDSASEEQGVPPLKDICQQLYLGNSLAERDARRLDEFHYHLCYFREECSVGIHADRTIMHRTVANIVEEIIYNGHRSFCIDLGGGRFLAITCHQAAETEGDDFAGLYRHITEKVEKYVNLQLHWGQSKIFRGFQELRDGLASVRESMRYLPILFDFELDAKWQQLPKALRLALDYIHSHYQANLSLEQVAEIANMRPSYFGALFREQVGVGFVEYLNQVRVAYAKELLLDTTDKIYQIAEQVGYNNSYYFNRVFKKYVGATPLEFRNR